MHHKGETRKKKSTTSTLTLLYEIHLGQVMTRFQDGHGPKRVVEFSERVAASTGQLVLDY